MLVDLTWPIEEHWRYPGFKREVLSSFEDGKLWQVTGFTMGSHWFSHIDFPRHTGMEYADSEDYPLDYYNGPASVIDLTRSSMKNYGISKKDIEQVVAQLGQLEKIWLLRTDWDNEVSHMTREFWTDAPFLTSEAIDYLATFDLNAIAFDFPQDYSIRLLLQRPVAPEEQETHIKLLRKGTLLIEYVSGFDRIGRNSCELICMPLNLRHIDGCPIRLVAKV